MINRLTFVANPVDLRREDVVDSVSFIIHEITWSTMPEFWWLNEWSERLLGTCRNGKSDRSEVNNWIKRSLLHRPSVTSDATMEHETSRTPVSQHIGLSASCTCISDVHNCTALALAWVTSAEKLLQCLLNFISHDQQLLHEHVVQ